ncbi:MAG TPA: T9SS type A sorting domain-containing protein, partial [Saprospiraceae bacterium]|nr:T9SS type A sorting domain-containing protein [Saprospiraceae bacterium]
VKFFDNTWMTDHSPTLQMYKQVSDGNVRLAFTRSSGQGASGNGIIGQAIWIVGEEEVDGLKSGSDFVLRNVSVENILFENSIGLEYQLQNSSLSVKQSLEGKDIIESNSLVFPNPVSNELNLYLDNNPNMVSIYSLAGIKLFSKALSSKISSLDVSWLLPGIYVLETTCGSVKQHYKIVKN